MKKKFVSTMTVMSLLSVAVLSGCGKSDAEAVQENYMYITGANTLMRVSLMSSKKKPVSRLSMICLRQMRRCIL